MNMFDELVCQSMECYIEDLAVKTIVIRTGHRTHQALGSQFFNFFLFSCLPPVLIMFLDFSKTIYMMVRKCHPLSIYS